MSDDADTQAEAPSSRDEGWDFVRDVSDLKEEFRKTGNPIFVWVAIKRLRDNEVHKHLFDEDWQAKRAWDAMPSSLPDWCVRYLVRVSWEIYRLSWGLDRRLEPRDVPGRSYEEHSKCFREWRGNPTLNFQDALGRLPAALGFSSPGWNAFANLGSHERRKGARYSYKSLRESGLSAKDAAERVMLDLGIEDERTFRRYIAAAKPPP